METPSARYVSILSAFVIGLSAATVSFYAGLLIGSKKLNGGGGKGTEDAKKVSSQEPVSVHMICGRSLPCKFPPILPHLYNKSPPPSQAVIKIDIFATVGDVKMNHRRQGRGIFFSN